MIELIAIAAAGAVVAGFLADYRSEQRRVKTWKRALEWRNRALR